MRLERDIELPATPDEVYNVVMDAHRLGDWVTIHDELKEGPTGILQKGDRILQRMKVAGKGFDVAWRVTTADRPRNVVWTGDGPVGSDAISEYRFEPTDTGTRFTYAMEFRPPGGVLGSFASRAVLSTSVPQREVDGSLERLKKLLGG